ncbi:MAG: hypothetical protein V9E94_14135 [Microthrixaceae bacterium]
MSEFDRPGIRAITEFAPGNSFYAGGHRHRIDVPGDRRRSGAVVRGTGGSAPTAPSPSIESRVGDDPPRTACPRCGGARPSPTSAPRHTVLRLRTALAASAEEDARVLRRDRRPRPWSATSSTTLVDVDPAEVRGAWLLEDRTFGAEFVEPGPAPHLQPGHRRTARASACAMAGRRSPRPALHRVPTLRRGARRARRPHGAPSPHRLHQGWCKVRSGSATRAVGPARAGPRAGHRGDPARSCPCRCTRSTNASPASRARCCSASARPSAATPTTCTVDDRRRSQPRRARAGAASCVLYDEVPGGTGYLGPLADPASIKRDPRRCP